MKINIPSHLLDAELVAAVKSLAGREREASGHLIAHLAELDGRRLYLGAGFSSLFTYCMEVLRLSEAEAYNRIEAARAARRFPVILDRLAEGSLSITTVRVLASCLTGDNHLELPAAASGKSRREVEELRARHFPQPDVAFSVRKLPAPRGVPAQPLAAASAPSASMTLASAPVTAPSAPVPALPAPATRRAVVAPLASDRYEIRFTASAETCAKLRLAQDMLRHAVPTGDTAQIIDRALTVLLEDLARKKVRRDRPAAGQPRCGPRLQVHRGEGQARGLDPRRRALRLRKQGGSPLQRAVLCRVPSPGSVWGGRRGHRRDDGASLSRPQQLRGRALLRPSPANSSWCRRGPRARPEALSGLSARRVSTITHGSKVRPA